MSRRMTVLRDRRSRKLRVARMVLHTERTPLFLMRAGILKPRFPGDDYSEPEDWPLVEAAAGDFVGRLFEEGKVEW